MGLEDDLYSELYGLRERLRSENRMANGRIPNVCSDEALREMAQRVPTKVDDFSAIVGVGQRFVEQYGEEFLNITRKYAITAANGSNIDEEAAKTLRELEKKLINISRSNRLLFQGKISRKNTFDLMSLPGIDVMSLLFGRKRMLKLCDSAKSPEDAKVYKHLNEIIREVNRELRDKGQYDLYIGYPFVQGKMPNDDFDIRAPLALFPVILEKDSRTITLSIDNSRDAMYNNTLILAYIKSTGRNVPLPNNIIEDYTGETFMDGLVEFYRSSGIKVACNYGLPMPFVDYKAGEFPQYLAGDMEVIPNVVLGKYPTYSSSIQRDFDGMLAGREINGILNDLVIDLDKSDFLSDLPAPLSETEIRDRGMEASERDLVYINSLNSAQENILTAVNKQDEIVVQGPPGTGKSQVITGLITSAVMKGKTVLMVSEKKTALDVVYSRLGNLARYCLLIDDVGNKDLFYKQLDSMLKNSGQKKGADIDHISDSIDRDVALLDNIAKVMYSPCDFGIEPYKLYSMDRWLDLTDRRQFDEYKILKDNIDPKLLSLRYPDVSELHRKFGDPVLMRNFDEYMDMTARYPWMTQMKADLSEYNIGEMKADLIDLEKQMTDFNSKGFVGKLFSKGKVTREATVLADKYFANYNEHTLQTIKDDPRRMFEGLDGYDTYTARSTVYNRLSDSERAYGTDILNISSETKMPYPDSNDRIFNWILNDHLQRFDASHKDIMQEIWDFDSIISDMDRKISEKRDLSRDKVEEIFQENLKYISESKRRGDINRIIESKRKWNLNKFINRYGYELFKGVRVWLLTPEVVSEILPLEMGIFDLLIFDEASQMYVEKGIPSIYRAKKVVVAGDHKQLRPSSLGTGRIEYESDEEDLDDVVSAALEEESLLDLARARYDSILLNFHYRSRYEELIAFSNYAFYGGRLYVSPNVVEPPKPPIEVFRVNGLWEDKSNKAEAEKIVSLLKEFFINRRNNETVGIITFNASQRDLINDMIDEECAKDASFGKMVADEMKRFDNGEDVGLFIKNIESVQGDERDVIIFSIGYAKNSEGKLMQRFGWLNNRGGENRLNVAISRAKLKILIVTSFDPEDLQVEETKNEGPRILKKYLQYARAISDGDRELADSILHSFGDDRWIDNEDYDSGKIADRVYSILTRKGYTVERNVGIGGYQIDLAVKQNDRYILGIECDSRLYELSSSTRERDYHRQKYLESRGWKIHRVWTPGMWKDPDKEIARIIEAIERDR
ncbi:MAG: AAA domain-containing protein [Candidatus Methanomethylophilaceae archaeon]|nr:AAA domain-containing protein [Candidatus Methanomethylophilaceae archaeon]